MSQVKIQEPDSPVQDIVSRYAEAAILQGQALVYSATTLDGTTVKKAPISTTTNAVMGVALADAAAGAQVQICTKGVCLGLVATATTAGEAVDVSGATAGLLVSGGALALADRIIAIGTNASGSNALTLVFLT